MAVELLHGNTIVSDSIIIPFSTCFVVGRVVNLLYCLMFFRILHNFFIQRTDLMLLGSG